MEQLQKAELAGIEAFHHWTVKTPCPPPGTRLVFLALENATSSAFEQYVRAQIDKGYCRRLVIDESHLIPLKSSFPPDFDQLDTLVGFGLQIIALTASLLKKLEQALLAKLALIANTNIIRAPSQPNVGYHVLDFRKEQIDPVVQA